VAPNRGKKRSARSGGKLKRKKRRKGNQGSAPSDQEKRGEGTTDSCANTNMAAQKRTSLRRRRGEGEGKEGWKHRPVTWRFCGDGRVSNASETVKRKGGERGGGGNHRIACNGPAGNGQGILKKEGREEAFYFLTEL